MQGWLQKIETLPTHSLPQLAAESLPGFDPWLLISFGRDVLTWMRQITSEWCKLTQPLAPCAPNLMLVA